MLDFSSIQYRKEYKKHILDPRKLPKDPFIACIQWFKEALKAEIAEANAMALATSTLEGRPSNRMVLMKSFGKRGLIFYTNYESRKGEEILQNPYAVALFYWHELERQLIIEGTVKKVEAKISTDYFALRPRPAQISSWVSKQDTVIPSREFLENEREKYEKKFRNKKIPAPPYWGGFRLIPFRFEFWQGRPNRFHDRIQYISENGCWKKERLSP